MKGEPTWELGPRTDSSQQLPLTLGIGARTRRLIADAAAGGPLGAGELVLAICLRVQMASAALNAGIRKRVQPEMDHFKVNR